MQRLGSDETWGRRTSIGAAARWRSLDGAIGLIELPTLAAPDRLGA